MVALSSSSSSSAGSRGGAVPPAAWRERDRRAALAGGRARLLDPRPQHRDVDLAGPGAGGAPSLQLQAAADRGAADRGRARRGRAVQSAARRDGPPTGPGRLHAAGAGAAWRVAVPPAVGIPHRRQGSWRLRQFGHPDRAARRARRPRSGCRRGAGLRPRPVLPERQEPRALCRAAVHGVLRPRPRHGRRRQPVPARLPRVDRDRARTARPDGRTTGRSASGASSDCCRCISPAPGCSAGPRPPPRRRCSR